MTIRSSLEKVALNAVQTANVRNRLAMGIIMAVACLAFTPNAAAQDAGAGSLAAVPPLTAARAEQQLRMLARELATRNAELAACQARCSNGGASCQQTLAAINVQIQILNVRIGDFARAVHTASVAANAAAVLARAAQRTANEAIRRVDVVHGEVVVEAQARSEGDRVISSRVGAVEETVTGTNRVVDILTDTVTTQNETIAHQGRALGRVVTVAARNATRTEVVAASVTQGNAVVRELARIVPEGWGMASLAMLFPAGQQGGGAIVGGGLNVGLTFYPSVRSWMSLDGALTIAPYRGVTLGSFGGGLLGGARLGDSVLLGGGLRAMSLQLTERVADTPTMAGVAPGSLGWLIAPTVRLAYAPRDSRVRCGADLGIGLGSELGTHVMLAIGCGASFNATAESITANLRDPGPPPPAVAAAN